MKTRAIYVSSDDGERLRLLGSTVTVKATGDDTGGTMEWVVIESTKGSDVAPHRHPWGEAYFMIDGVLEVQVGARKHVATAGDFITIPPRAVHGFQVVSDSARFVHVTTGAGTVDAYKDYARVSPEVPDPNDGEAMAALAEVNERHGLEFLTPASV
jgi:quercetin dioxygenase-like cupin family protein